MSLPSKNAHFLAKFLNPSSIAVYGASDNILTNMGTAQLMNLMDNGYKGRLYPIHLRLPEILGIKAYKTISEVPEVPDLAIVVLPNRVIPQIFKEFSEKGVKNVVLVTAGFREMDNAAGEIELKQMADQYGIRFFGPNCLGVLNTHCSLPEKPEESFILNCMWVNYRSSPGNIGMASQSGTYAAHPFMLLPERHIGFSCSLSIGNEANIDIVDCLEFFENDPHSDVICLYIEELKRGKKFFEVARRVAPKKPIIAIYVGGSEAGAKAAASHTGAMAGNDDVFNGMFHQAGIIRVQNIEEMLDTAMLLSKTVPKGAIPSGKRLMIITNAGGPGITMADQAFRLGLSIPQLSPDLAENIRPYLPPTAKPGNPLDYTFSINPSVFFETIPKMISKSGEVDAIACYGGYGPSFIHFCSEFGKNIMARPENQKAVHDFQEVAEASVDAMRGFFKKYKVPIIFVNFLGNDDSLFAYLNKKGFPTYKMPHQAISALKNLIDYGEFRNKTRV